MKNESTLSPHARRAMNRRARVGAALIFAVWSGSLWACGDPPMDAVNATGAACDAPPAATYGERFDHFLTLGDPICRMRSLADLLETTGADRIESLRDFIDAKQALIDDASLWTIARWYAGLDAAEALEFARGLPENRRAVAIRAAFERWAEIDADAATSALDALRTNKLPEGAAIAVARGWETSGRPGLAQFIATRSATKSRRKMLTEVLRRKTERDGPMEMLQWVENLSDELPNALRADAHQAAVTALAHGHGPTARDWINSRSISDERLTLSRTLARQWVVEDAAAAMNWMRAMDAGVERDRIVRDAYGALARAEPDLANDWFMAQPYEPWMEPILSYRLGALAHRDGAAAIDRVDEIEDEARRRKTIVSILRQWFKQDAEAADAWLATSELPPEMQKRLRARRGSRFQLDQPEAGLAPQAGDGHAH